MLSYLDIKRFFNELFNAAIATLIIAGVISLIPEKFLVDNTLPLISYFANWVDKQTWLITLIGFGLLCLPSTRGTIKYFVFNSRKEKTSQAATFLLTASLLFAFSFYFTGTKALILGLLGGVYFLLSGVIVVVLLANKKFPSLENNSLQSDELVTKEELLFGDQVVAMKDLNSLIGNEQKIRSIGLFGDWGVGKTTICNICRQKIQSTHDDILWLDFKPWQYTSPESLVLGFYSEIGQLLEQKIPGKQNSLAKLLEASEPFVKKQDSSGIVGVVGDFLHKGQADLEKPREYINNTLKYAGKRLVIIMDDVERCFDEAIINQSLQLVHELGDSRVSYIFIADKDSLLKCLPARVEQKRNEYLEKFIEHEIHIATPSTADLRAYLDKLLEKKFKSLPDMPAIEVDSKILDDIHSYRGILKVFNSFAWKLEEKLYEESA